MKYYIGVKLVKTEKETRNNIDGYRVIYESGYESWCPADVFEHNNIEVTANTNLKTELSIGAKMVQDFIKDIDISTIGVKTTLVRVTLVNGFEIVETSACVDAKNYDEAIGAQICLKKIEDKIWNYLGFLLQTATRGVSN